MPLDGRGEHAGQDGEVSGHSFQVTPGLPDVTLQFLDFEAKGLGSQKGCLKKIKVREMCEVLSLGEGKAEVRMEVLCRPGGEGVCGRV